MDQRAGQGPFLNPLDHLRQAEEENLGITTQILGDTLGLVPQLSSLYDWLAAELAKPGGAQRCKEAVPGLQFLRMSQYFLFSAVLSCLRCHVTESFADTRMAIEGAAVLAKMKRRPELANLWLEAGIDEQAAKRYRKETAGPELFPGSDGQLAKLRTYYDLCAKQTHPGLVSMVRRLRVPGDFTFEFHWFDVTPRSRAEPARTFLWTVQTHLRLLELYGSIFNLALDETAWMLRRNAAEASCAVHREKWMSRIAGDGT